jgi:hypothetical protein
LGRAVAGHRIAAVAGPAGTHEVREPMPSDWNTCPQCEASMGSSRFDATFRLSDGSERLCFGMPASLCGACRQLYVDPELIDLFDLAAGRCVFAIESDRVLLRQARLTTG